jgi:hypothetical protein
MIDRFIKTHEEQPGPAGGELPPPAKRAYEPPRCVKKRSIHRVTLISGNGPTGVSAVSTTN